jgi:hypothetical protein
MNNSPDDWRLFMVVGTQRTGTTLLRDILNSNDNVVMVAEVMLPHLDSCHWDHFAPNLSAGSLPPPDEASGLDMLDRYFRYIHCQVRAKWNDPRKSSTCAIGVDIKCDQLRLVEPVGWPATAAPFMLHYARQRSVVLINTIRRNVVQCAVSFLLGLQRNFWHNYEGRGMERAYELNVGECIAYARGIVEQQQEFERVTKGYPVARCHYDDLVATIAQAGPGGDLSSHPGPLQEIADALGIPCRFGYDGRLQRAINRPYSEVISNHGALLAAIRASEFASFADTIA